MIEPVTAVPRRTAAMIEELDRLLPGRFAADGLTLEGYRRDEALTVKGGTPSVVVFPTSTTQVQEAVRLAGKYGVGVVPRGAGSGLAGGAAASEGCMVLSLERMNRIHEIDPLSLTAVVEPGVINAHLAREARDVGLTYAPDPASRDVSTLGGNIATNAGGLCCVKYGVTRDAVLGLEVVLADGSALRLGRRTLKGVAGYDLTSLLVGSEGTLGIITEATLRLRPPPQPAATCIAFFPSLAAAGDAAASIRQRVVPSLLELLDSTVIASVEGWKHLGLDTSAAGMLLGQSDTGGDQARRETAVMLDACHAAGASMVAETTDPLETEVFLSARKLALPSLSRNGLALLDDVAVPCMHMSSLILCIEEIAERLELRIAVYGHAGDGNLHPTIMLDQGAEESLHRAEQAFDAIARAALSFGGTIAGEHGVGLLKRHLLGEEVGEAVLGLQRRVKQLFDPQHLMNPGKAA